MFAVKCCKVKVDKENLPPPACVFFGIPPTERDNKIDSIMLIAAFVLIGKGQKVCEPERLTGIVDFWVSQMDALPLTHYCGSSTTVGVGRVFR